MSEPLISLLGHIAPSLNIPISKLIISGCYGIFGFWAISHRLNTGEIDRAIAEMYSANTVTSSLSYNKHPFGWGVVYGGALSFKVNPKILISLKTKYYSGKAPLNLKGTYYIGYSNTQKVEFKISYSLFLQ